MKIKWYKSGKLTKADLDGAGESVFIGFYREDVHNPDLGKYYYDSIAGASGNTDTVAKAKKAIVEALIDFVRTA